MSMQELAARYSLERVGARPPLFTYLREVWRRRDFTISLARYRIKSENERNKLGMLWVLLSPMLSAAVYGIIFGFILAGSRPDNFVPFVIIGVFSMQFFNSSMNGGAKSIVKNMSLVQSLPFPRMVLPIANVTQNLLNFVPTVLLMVLLCVFTGAVPTWSWFLLVPLTVLFWMFNQGVAFFFARLTVHFRDLNNFTPVISRLCFYTAGVFFDPMDIAQGDPIIMTFFDWNPLYEVLALTRGILLQEYDIPWEYWGHLALWAIVILVVGTVFFWQAEERYGREE